MKREHGPTCRCAKCRHARFNPGPPSKPAGFYGNLKVGSARKRWAQKRRVEAAHAAALVEHEARGFLGKVLAAIGLR